MRRVITKGGVSAAVVALVVFGGSPPAGSHLEASAAAFQVSGCRAAGLVSSEIPNSLASMASAVPSTVAHPQAASGVLTKASSVRRARSAIPRAVQVHVDPRTQATFFTRFTDDGMAVLDTSVGELAVQKIVGRDGRVQIVARAADETVSLTLAPGTVDLLRGDRSYHLEFGSASDADFLAVKTLLAGSRAVWLFRILAAGLDPATLKTPAGIGTLLTDAVLGLLDGDVAAVDRLGQYFEKARKGRLRRAMVEGCYETYEAEVVRAWGSYVDCKMDFAMWNPLRQACTARWMLWAESAWFSFLSCSAMPIR